MDFIYWVRVRESLSKIFGSTWLFSFFFSRYKLVAPIFGN